MKRIAALSLGILMSASVLFADQSSSGLEAAVNPVVTAGREPVAFSVGAQARSENSDMRITVIGCVRRSESPIASVGTTVIPEGQTKYMLSNITLAGDPGDAGSPAAILSEAVKDYRLDDSGAAMIAPHVGDRVQVTGTVMTKSSSPVGPAGTAGRSMEQSARPPMLRVESLRPISTSSSSCPE